MIEYKTFFGKDLTEAIAKAKVALGVDLKIVAHDVVKKGGFLGIGGKEMVKVVAIKPEDDFFIRNRSVSPPDIRKIKPVNNNIKLEQELQDIKEKLSLLMSNKENNVIPADTQEFQKEKNNSLVSKYTKILRNNDFGEELINIIFDKLKKTVDINNFENEETFIMKLREQIKKLINVKADVFFNGSSPHIVFFVGPTGVGKTTTLVKLAANYKLKENKGIDIFTIDNYRVGAVEQLKAYAEIMQTPFKKVDDKKELKTAIDNSKADLIFIDTAGRSPKDDISISKLRDFVKSLRGEKMNLDVFLVLDARTKKNDMMTIAEKYKIVNFNYLIYTKLDETTSTGALIESSFYIKKPISFVTFGQDVPKHIGVVDPELLVDLAVKE